MASVGESLSKLATMRVGGVGGSTDQDLIRIRLNTQDFDREVEEAERDLERLDREAQGINRRRARFPARNNVGGSPGVGSAVAQGGILQRLRKRGFGVSSEGLRFKAFRIGSGGFTIEGGSLTGVSQTALIVVAGSRAAGSVVQGINKFNRFRDEGRDVREAAIRVGRDATLRTFNQVSDFVGAKKLVSELGELFGGDSAESNAQTIEKFYSDFFTTRQERDEIEAARSAFLEESFREIDKFIADQWAKLEDVRPKTFKLRNRPQLRAFQRELKDQNRNIIDQKEAFQKNEAKRQAENFEMAGT